MDLLKYKGYSGTVEYSATDNCLFGRVQGMSGVTISYEGQTLEELRKDFEDGVDSYLDDCAEDGITPQKPFSGKLNFRMSPQLHESIAYAAKVLGVSINDTIIKGMEEFVSKPAFSHSI